MKRKQSAKKSAVKKEIFVNFVLDETGSMQSCLDATISGFNEYIKSLKSKGEILFTLTKFNSAKTEVVHKAVSLKEVKDLNPETYKPNEMTPLYDAIGKSIHALDSKAVGKQSVLCVIMTDGEENSSKEYTRDKITSLIKDKEKDGWTFVYLGANQDAWKIGQTLGMHKGNVRSYDTQNTKGVMRGMAMATQCYASFSASNATGATMDSLLDDSKFDKESKEV